MTFTILGIIVGFAAAAHGIAAMIWIWKALRRKQ